MKRNVKRIDVNSLKCCVGLRIASVCQGNKHNGMNHNKKSQQQSFLGALVKVNKCRNKIKKMFTYYIEVVLSSCCISVSRFLFLIFMFSFCSLCISFILVKDDHCICERVKM